MFSVPSKSDLPHGPWPRKQLLARNVRLLLRAGNCARECEDRVVFHGIGECLIAGVKLIACDRMTNDMYRLLELRIDWNKYRAIVDAKGEVLDRLSHDMSDTGEATELTSYLGLMIRYAENFELRLEVTVMLRCDVYWDGARQLMGLGGFQPPRMRGGRYIGADHQLSALPELTAVQVLLEDPLALKPFTGGWISEAREKGFREGLARLEADNKKKYGPPESHK